MVPSWADQLLLQLWMEQFDTLPIQCRHIEHMHEGVGFRKNNFWQNYSYENLDNFSLIRLLNMHRWCLLNLTGFPHNRENRKSPGIRYWSFTAMKSPGISTFGDLSRELSGKICSLAHPQRRSYAWMLNLVYQLFFAWKQLNCSSTTAFVIRQVNNGISTGEYLLVPANIIR